MMDGYTAEQKQKAVDQARRFAVYSSRLKSKYGRAVFLPWLPVEPDPAPPCAPRVIQGLRTVDDLARDYLITIGHYNIITAADTRKPWILLAGWSLLICVAAIILGVATNARFHASASEHEEMVTATEREKNQFGTIQGILINGEAGKTTDVGHIKLEPSRIKIDPSKIQGSL
jgi:hypothetical protein